MGIDHPMHLGHFNYLIQLKETIPKIKVNCLLLKILDFKNSLDNLQPYMPEGPVSEEIKNFVKLIGQKKSLE